MLTKLGHTSSNIICKFNVEWKRLRFIAISNSHRINFTFHKWLHSTPDLWNVGSRRATRNFYIHNLCIILWPCDRILLFTQNWETTLSQCHYVHRKSHVDWLRFELGSSRWGLKLIHIIYKDSICASQRTQYASIRKNNQLKRAENQSLLLWNAQIQRLV